MNSATRQLTVPGPVGPIDCALDLPPDGVTGRVAEIRAAELAKLTQGEEKT